MTYKTPLLIFICLFSLLLTQCATTSKSKADNKQQPQCSSVDVQRVLTYCVSPAAARFAKSSDDVRALQQKGHINPKIFPLPIANSPVKGPATAAVTLVVFSDLECPYCAQAHKNINGVLEAFPNDVRVVYKHFPLSFHKNAKSAAIAAHAAHQQGKFFEFVDMAYTKQASLSKPTFMKIAQSLKLNTSQFEKDLSSPIVQKAVAQDIALSSALHLQGTPSIFLNGVLLPSALNAQELKPIIAQQKKIVQAFLAAGVPQSEIYWRMVRAQYQSQPEPQPEKPQILTAYVPVLDSPSKGASADDAIVTIVVFSDFECPYCANANPPIYQMLTKYPKHVRVVFKHFPLPFHKQADDAAALSIVAQAQGKFWPLHDLLFSRQDALDHASLAKYAQSLNIKVSDVASLSKDKKTLGIITRDMRAGINAGVNGTPTFFINGSKQVGAMSSADLSALIDVEIKTVSELKAKSKLKGEALYEAVVKLKMKGEK